MRPLASGFERNIIIYLMVVYIYHGSSARYMLKQMSSCYYSTLQYWTDALDVVQRDSHRKGKVKKT